MNKMLVVDDETDVCDFVKLFFEERHYDVKTAHNGEEAIRMVKKEPFNIILLDIRMRKMDGITALRRIREVNKTVPVIMVTAIDDQGNMDEAGKLGASHYITKPLVLEDLESAVYEVTKATQQQ